MLTYNTRLERLILPEYGRTVQKMVEYCMTLPTKEERTVCAEAIFKCISNIIPELKNSPEESIKVWNHLAIISGFKLDIDYPCEILDEEKLHSRPSTVPYGGGALAYRHYGRLIQAMIDYVASLEEGPERDSMAEDIANQIKKTLVVASGEEVEDSRVFDDLAQLSHGAIRISTEELTLKEYKVAPQPAGKKKKKK